MKIPKTSAQKKAVAGKPQRMQLDVASGTRRHLREAHVLPLWVRLPSEKAGAFCPYTNLQRSKLVELIENSGGAIKTSKLVSEGRDAKRSTLLVNLESLLTYLDNL